MWQYQNTDELYHYGVLGMKWGHRKSLSQIISDRKAYRKKFKENYKTIKKHSSLKDKLLYNNSTRKYAAKQMTKNNMSEKDAVKKSKKVAWRNTAIIVGGALAAYGATKLVKARNDKLYDKGLSTIKKVMSDERKTQYKRLARELSTAKPSASGNIKGKFGGIAYKVGADGRSSINSYLNYKNMHLGQLDDKDIRSIGKNVKNIRKYLR